MALICQGVGEAVEGNEEGEQPCLGIGESLYDSAVYRMSTGGKGKRQFGLLFHLEMFILDASLVFLPSKSVYMLKTSAVTYLYSLNGLYAFLMRQEPRICR